MQRSYGEEEFQIGNFRCGTIRVLGIHSLPALYPRLGITLGWSLREIPASEGHYGSAGLRDYRITSCDGELRLGRGNAVVGPVQPTPSNVQLRSSQYHSEQHVTLACDLDLHRLERIERERVGGPAPFSLLLWSTAVRSGEVVDARIDALRFEIPREEWLDFLSSVGYGEYDVVEIKRFTDELEHFAEVRDQLHAARAKVNRGDYNAAMAALRTALERAIQQSKDNEQELKEVLSARTDKTRGEAYTGIISRAKTLCNLAVHKPEATISYSREEVLFALRTVEAVVALLGDLLGGEGARG
jgi:Arc/MetJ-type ribon-helix-helix transcriptional regulator